MPARSARPATFTDLRQASTREKGESKMSTLIAFERMPHRRKDGDGKWECEEMEDFFGAHGRKEEGRA